VPPLGSTGPARRLPSCDQLTGLKRSSALNGGSGGGSLTGVFFRSMTNHLRRVALHLYCTFNDDIVLVRALWGARRERGPQLGLDGR
jgi:hypothetical protein